MDMRGLKKNLLALLVCHIMVLDLSPNEIKAAFLYEQDKTTFLVSGDPEALKSIGRLVIFLSGSEANYVKVLQDALSIELKNTGWNVVSRLEVETAVTRDFEQWALLPDSVRAQTQKKGDAAAVSELVNADTYLTGTVLVGRQQYTNIDKNFNASAEKIVVTSLSFQIVRLKQRKIVFEAVIGYINGKSVVFVAQDIRQIIKQHLGR